MCHLPYNVRFYFWRFQENQQKKGLDLPNCQSRGSPLLSNSSVFRAFIQDMRNQGSGTFPTWGNFYLPAHLWEEYLNHSTIGATFSVSLYPWFFFFYSKLFGGFTHFRSETMVLSTTRENVKERKKNWTWRIIFFMPLLR